MSFPQTNNSKKQNWYVLRVGSRKEKYVSSQVSSMGLEPYVPLRTRTYSYPSKVVTRDLPIIPNYVFVSCKASSLGKLLSIPFVYNYLGGDRPGTVTELEMNRLTELSNTPHLDWVEGLTEQQLVNPGDMLSVISGPLSGLRGYLLRKKNRHVFLVSFGANLTQLGTYEIKAQDLASVSEAVYQF